MLQLIWYQFNYSKKQWLGTIPVFFMSSLLTGACLTVAFSVKTNAHVFSKVGMPTPLFTFPVFFGGLTLLF
ncbi:uncharacterized protein SRT_19470 [Streptococcus troglodytae]|uniref:Uncharacterized protein n=1 Tax=Streptococcus troglodytae TaxID=1111760 RepID=A0A1L7LM63_9STRE|nr:hypothetical protein [Streptococcus troglodytae]BAQ25208.1 uncharacterized protein SRT_19470 [Streptococcus troglodytae]